MSDKTIRIKYCDLGCRYCSIIRDEEYFCSFGGQKKKLDAMSDTIPPDCRLPDWPRVSHEEIYHLLNSMPHYITAIKKLLRSKGIDVED